jgi:hypothetical protein
MDHDQPLAIFSSNILQAFKYIQSITTQLDRLHLYVVADLDFTYLTWHWDEIALNFITLLNHKMNKMNPI